MRVEEEEFGEFGGEFAATTSFSGHDVDVDVDVDVDAIENQREKELI